MLFWLQKNLVKFATLVALVVGVMGIIKSLHDGNITNLILSKGFLIGVLGIYFFFNKIFSHFTITLIKGETPRPVDLKIFDRWLRKNVSNYVSIEEKEKCLELKFTTNPPMEEIRLVAEHWSQIP